MYRAYLAIKSADVSSCSDDHLFGQLAQKLPFAVEPTQTAAWQYQIRHLRSLAEEIPGAFFCMEFLIPRMGRRTDLIIIVRGVIFVVEYKLGAHHFDRSSLDQVYGYGLDLKNFHEPSHSRKIIPILVATEAAWDGDQSLRWDRDDLAKPLKAKPHQLAAIVNGIAEALDTPALDPLIWLQGRYHPTPTIVEAAQALYRGHDVEEISRSEAGAENLTRTTAYIASLIESAKENASKIICFITGVPGSGKTLAGLNLATARQRLHKDEHAVFLSGNGPLVEVLRKALAMDAVAKARKAFGVTSKNHDPRSPEQFIQNIHHFRDCALVSQTPPIEKVAIFDEAQRAWNFTQTAQFMKRKKGIFGFSISEPEFLLSVMDRHIDWCAIICLVGGGQEINTGEAGIEEWLRALDRSFQHWQFHIPETLNHICLIENRIPAPDLHLSTSIRSFRAERLSDFVGHVIDGNQDEAALIKSKLPNYPLLITRDLDAARRWLRSQRRSNERAGLLASSNAARLKPHGIFVKAKIEPEKWFLSASTDVRSSDRARRCGDRVRCSRLGTRLGLPLLGRQFSSQL